MAHPSLKEILHLERAQKKTREMAFDDLPRFFFLDVHVENRHRNKMGFGNLLHSLPFRLSRSHSRNVENSRLAV
jgi:hypothetical protein